MKKIFLSIGAVALAATMVFSASLGITGSSPKMSAIMLANIEALAKDEGGGCENDCTYYMDKYHANNGCYYFACVTSRGTVCLIELLYCSATP